MRIFGRDRPNADSAVVFDGRGREESSAVLSPPLPPDHSSGARTTCRLRHQEHTICAGSQLEMTASALRTNADAGSLWLRSSLSNPSQLSIGKWGGFLGARRDHVIVLR